MERKFSLAATAEPGVATPALHKLTVLFILMLAVGVAAGLYSFIAGHHAVYNNTRQMPWGVLISGYAFFAITSTGLCLLAIISHVFGGNRLAPLANRMVWLSIITIIGAFTLIGMELESPWRMALYNITSPNPTSNIWWMGTFYGGAVAFMLVEFFFILTRRYKLAVILGVLGALTEVAANTTLGGVFATMPGRPFWSGAQLPVYFLACAFMSGAAAAIFFTHGAVRMRGQKMEAATFEGLQTAGKVLLLTLILVGVATVWRMVNFYVGGTEEGRLAANVLLIGPLSTNFWIFEVTIGMALPIALLALTRLNSVAAMSTAAVMTLVGQFVSRYDLVVGGQIVPQFHEFKGIAAYASYTPSAAEILVVMAGIGFIGLTYLLGERFFGRVFESRERH